MLNSRLLGAVALTFTTALAAQAQDGGVPAEYPPQSFSANQYIDSLGCAFIRAGVSGNVTWVPRVSRDRSQLCGFQPSLATTPAAAPTPELVATPVQAPDTAPPPVPIPVAAPRPAAPRPTADVGPPIATVAGLTSAPRITAPASSPAVVPMPAATPAIAAAAAPTPTPRLTRAEACQGRTGIQSGFVSDRTGLPIDCGAGSATVRPATFTLPDRFATAPRMTRAAACVGRFGLQRNFISERTGEPIDCGPLPGASSTVIAADIRGSDIVGPFGTTTLAMSDPFPGIRRATLTEVCTEVALTGARFVNVVTGLRVMCDGVPVLVASGAGIRMPTGPLPVGGPAVPGLTAPVATTLAQTAVRPQTTRAAARAPSGFGELVSPSPVPASNPINAQVQHIRPPSGYERVWNDGRINPDRGVPQPVSGQVVQSRTLSRTPVVAAAPQAVVPAGAPAPQAAVSTAPSRRFIQVGTYGLAANADATAARLRGLGLPVGFATATRNGQQLRIVAAGPFASAAQLNAALQAVRSAGFGDAFARN